MAEGIVDPLKAIEVQQHEVNRSLLAARDFTHVARQGKEASPIVETGERIAGRLLEQALDPAAPSPFTAAMRGAHGTIDELLAEVETTYLAELV